MINLLQTCEVSIYIVSHFFSQSAHVFVKGCNEASCGPWTACPAACNTAGTQTRDCTDPVCGVEEEQRPCTGPCKHSCFFRKSVMIILLQTFGVSIIYIVSSFFQSECIYIFVKDCNEAICGPWSACGKCVENSCFFHKV